MDYYKKRTMQFDNIKVIDGYTIVGPKEGSGKLKGYFDWTLQDDMFGQSSFERAERKMFEHAVEGVIAKSNIIENEVDAIVGGDLLNQIVSTSFTARKLHAGFLGLYNACATFVESLIVGASLLNNKLDNVLCVSGSHFSTAERQYRYPLELGVLRSPVSQWTATGVGATVLSNTSSRSCPHLTRATIGRVIDYGIVDANNMGAAMAPSAMDTLLTFFKDTDTKASDYDLIATGDLGKFGSEILLELMQQEGYDLADKLYDCGANLYYEEQQTYQGGSGAACSAITFNGKILHELNSGKIKNCLLIGTGALMSTTTSFQGDSIPAIAHLVEICNVGDEQ